MVRGTLNPTQVRALLQNGSRYGFSVATAGDVDGDGFSDILVGAPDFDSIGTNDGRAYLLRGGPGGTATVSWITTAETASTPTIEASTAKLLAVLPSV